MSTVTTRLCHYGHEDCNKHLSVEAWENSAPKQSARQRANQAWAASRAGANARLVATIETRLAAGLGGRQISTEVGYTRIQSLRRHLYNLGRGDLARCLYDDRKPRKGQPKGKAPQCALDCCSRPAVWIWDAGLDPDDEPIAHWNYLCRRCQDFEDLVEDLEFLLDPKRGGETSSYRICERVGYGPNVQGLEALRQRLKRHGRIDLRDRLDITSVKGQRTWHVQGTVRSDVQNHWLRLVSAEGVRAYERQVADPGRVLTGSRFR